MTPVFEVHSYGIDYIRFTEKRIGNASLLGRVFRQHVAGLVDKFDKRASSKRLGYTGESVGKWFYGIRENDSMLQVSGAESGIAFRQCVGLAVKCTRIDVQCTVRSVAGRLPLWGQQAALHARNERQHGRGRPVKIPHIDGDGAGDTVFFGSRSSSKFGRLYDKEMESLDPAYASCWRYEVEYKNAMAPIVFAHLSQQSEPSQAAAQMVVGQFDAWGAPLPVDGIPKGPVLHAPREETSVERAERWLLSQVLPTLARLVDTGHEDVVDRLMYQV